jgi:hypothetical protein
MAITRKAWYAVLFAIGCVGGALFAVLMMRNDSLSVSASAPHIAIADEDAREALACYPREQADDIFFISCGGIY